MNLINGILAQALPLAHEKPKPTRHVLSIDETITLRGKRNMNVKTWEGTGPTIVMLHGLLDSASGWTQLACDVANPVVAIDLPGFGKSDLPRKKELASYADDVIKTLEQLKIRKYILVGHSFGGAVATVMSETPSEKKKIKHLVLIAPAGFGHIALADIVNLPIIRNVSRKALPFLLSNPILTTAAYTLAVSHHKTPSKELIYRLEEGRDRAGHGVNAAVAALASSSHSAKCLGKRRVNYLGPVTLIYGKDDQLIPHSHVKRITENSFPQAEIIELKDVGHHPQFESPQRLSNIINRLALK